MGQGSVSSLEPSWVLMTLTALASVALADPARSPPPPTPRYRAHLGCAVTSAIAASLSRHPPAAESAVMMPPLRLRPPSRRGVWRRCAAASAAATAPLRLPVARAHCHCAGAS